MGRTIHCRWCAAEDTVTAGVFPATCAICGNIGRWSTEPHGPLIERRKSQPKGPRVPFDLNANDKRMLRRLRIAEV